MIDEKRKYIRFKVQDKLYVALGTYFSKVGRLKDISMDGLSFQYIENIKGTRQDSTILSIFHSEDLYYLPNLICTVIEDRPIYSNGKISDINPVCLIKRCAVKFMNIDTGQKEKLEFLINNYTCGFLPSLNQLNT
jgi:hypothetical protein